MALQSPLLYPEFSFVVEFLASVLTPGCSAVRKWRASRGGGTRLGTSSTPHLKWPGSQTQAHVRVSTCERIPFPPSWKRLPTASCGALESLMTSAAASSGENGNSLKDRQLMSPISASAPRSSALWQFCSSSTGRTVPSVRQGIQRRNWRALVSLSFPLAFHQLSGGKGPWLLWFFLSSDHSFLNAYYILTTHLLQLRNPLLGSLLTLCRPFPPCPRLGSWTQEPLRAPCCFYGSSNFLHQHMCTQWQLNSLDSLRLKYAWLLWVFILLLWNLL